MIIRKSRTLQITTENSPRLVKTRKTLTINNIKIYTKTFLSQFHHSKFYSAAHISLFESATTICCFVIPLSLFTFGLC